MDTTGYESAGSAEPAPPVVAGPDAAAVIAAPLSPWATGWRSLLLRPEMGLPLITLLFGVYLAFASQYFLQYQNILNITEAIAVLGIAASFATVVVVSGGIDLTPVTVEVMAGIVCLHALNGGIPVPLVVLLALAAAAGIGLLNGLLIGLGRVHSIIVTFGMLNILRVVSFKATGGKWLSGVPGKLNYFGNGTLLKLPFAWWIAMALGAAATYYLRRRPTGRHLYALGGNAETARLAGVAVLKRTIFVYAITGTLVGVASIVFVGGTSVIQTNVGVGFELDVIAAVVIGGTSILGGKGSVVGTLLGALLVGTIRNALVVVNASALYTGLILGGLILVTVGLDLLRRRGREA